MPVTIAQFFDRLLASAVLSPVDVDALWKRIPVEKRQESAERLTPKLIKSGTLTRYQAEALLEDQGRTLVLGEYVILDKIGAGGMGQVYQARHRRMKRVVALKVLPPGVMDKPEAVKRFQREVEAAARLSHPNIVAALDAGEQKGIHYLVMEFVDGDDLAQVVRKQGPLPVETAVSYVGQAAKGLAHAHKSGVIHRDIKPANLLLDDQGTVKILDMGLARLETAAANGPVEDVTQTGSLMGTVDFMSPEQALDTKRADARSDVYSLGCTLYYLLTGRRMYDGDTMMTRLVAHRELPIPDLCAERADVPPSLAAVFERLVAKRADDRYQNMEEARAALETCPLDLAVIVAGRAAEGETHQRAGSSALRNEFAGVPAPSEPLALSQAHSPTYSVADPSFLTADFSPPPPPASAVNRWQERKLAEQKQQALVRYALLAAAGTATLAAAVVLLCGLVWLGGKWFEKTNGSPPVALASSQTGGVVPADSATTPPATNPANSNPASTDNGDLPVKPGSPANGQFQPAPPVAQTPAGAGGKTNPLPDDPFAEPPPSGAGNKPGSKASAVSSGAADDGKPDTPATPPTPKPGDVIENSLKMKFVYIPPGAFERGFAGSPLGDEDEGERHKVRITQPFLMATTETTIGQTLAWLNDVKRCEPEWIDLESLDCPIKQTGKAFALKGGSCKFGHHLDQPIVEISWYGAREFADWLTRQDGRTYRLPTEAEWEYACRAGTTTEFHFGDILNGDLANCNGTRPSGTKLKGKYLQCSATVSAYAANAWGLYDMHGNVWEWCWDWYAEYEGDVVDPMGPGSGFNRVIRGGSWNSNASFCRSGSRSRYTPSYRLNNVGFRVVCDW